MAEILIKNNDVPVAKTSKAIDVKITKELMRMYKLEFDLVVIGEINQYINKNASFEVDGQQYDIDGYIKNYGEEKITKVSAEHVAYRLNNYALPPGYAIVGTATEILEDMLNMSYPIYDEDGKTKAKGQKGADEFQIGTVANVGNRSLDLRNDGEVTLRYGIMALKEIGVEVDFDNFTINLPLKCGTGNTKTFTEYNDLAAFREIWDLENGSTYEADIADLQKIPGHSGDVFDVGDEVSFLIDGRTITERIITYTRYLDDPTKNSITLGKFKSDISSDIVSMQVQIDNSLKSGHLYNNVSISRQDGFRSTTADGLVEVKHNAVEGFTITHNNDDIFHINSYNGEIIISNRSGTVQVKMGADNGFQVFNHGELVAGLDTDGNSIATKVMMPDSPFYIRPGVIQGGTIGCSFVDEEMAFLNIWKSEGHETVLQYLNSLSVANNYDDRIALFNNNGLVLPKNLIFQNGFFSASFALDSSGALKIDGNKTYNGQVTISGVTLTIKHGLITGIS